MGAIAVANVGQGAEPDATATPEKHAVRVTYEAPETCPSRELLYDAIQARTARFELSNAEDAPEQFEITITDEGQRFVGQLTARTQVRASETREVRARSCEEVAETFALVIAVAIDPDARLTRKPSPASQPESPPPQPEAPKPIPAPATAAVAPSLVARGAQPEPKASEPGASWAWIAGAGLQVQSSPTYGGALAPLAFVDAAHEPSRGIGFGARAGFWHAFPKTIADQLGREVDFSLSCARLEALLAMVDSSSLALQWGVGLDVGLLHVEPGDSTPDGLEETRWWVAPLALGRLRWSPARLIRVYLDAGATVPLVRDNFELVNPNLTLLKPAPVSGFLGAALGLRFL